MEPQIILKFPPVTKILGKVEIETIIKKIECKKLKQTEKNYLYRSIRPKLVAANLLASADILKQINTDAGKRDTFLIEYNLSLYGYHLISPTKKKLKKLSIEDLITLILTKYSSARFIEAIPFIMIMNKLNDYKLLDNASKFGIKNKLGYLIETAFIFKQLPNLDQLLNYLKNNKDKNISLLTGGDYNFLMKTSPERVKRWNLLGRFFDEDFKKLAEVYL